jgi:hypothetical protein
MGIAVDSEADIACSPVDLSFRLCRVCSLRGSLPLNFAAGLAAAWIPKLDTARVRTGRQTRCGTCRKAEEVWTSRSLKRLNGNFGPLRPSRNTSQTRPSGDGLAKPAWWVGLDWAVEHLDPF